MAQMVATYDRDRTLNVRREPSQASGVVRRMAPGESAVVEEVRDGWARLHGGYVDARLVTIRLSEDKQPDDQTPEPAETAPEPDGPAQPDPDEAAELYRMTNTQLYDLAEKCGVRVKKGSNKAELIAAILADA